MNNLVRLLGLCLCECVSVCKGKPMFFCIPHDNVLFIAVITANIYTVKRNSCFK